ncbi:MAG: exodeoxyribonuclease V subunit alpha [Thermodesulfobacteriota bacterium]
MTAAPLRNILAQLVADGHFAPVDRYFVQTLARLDPGASPVALLAAALARRAIDHGHVCFDLAHPAPELAAALARVPFWPAVPAEVVTALSTSALVGNDGVAAPLRLAGNRLYLARYWDYEKRLAEAIRARIGGESPPTGEVTAAAARLDALLAGSAMTASEAQRQAIIMAATRRLAVISGGPGTGKTTIVVYLLALMQELARLAGRAFARPLLLAPTGKAAARLAQAIQERLATLPVGEAVRAALPCEAATIHRALGYQPRTPTVFRHGADNPLPAEVVIVDEASMVDLALMAKLFAAVGPEARLVLLGDKDQLASVEAGSLMGDLCLAAGIVVAPGEAPAATPLRGAVAQLTASFRFKAGQGIGTLVRHIQAGDSAAMLALLDGRQSDAVLHPATMPLAASLPLREAIVAGYRAALTAASPSEALAGLQGFRVLCAHRRGIFGVTGLNALCERVLAEAGLLRPQGEWYQGRPLLVTANNYALRLFNGDLGVVWPDPADGVLRAWFSDPVTGRLRALPQGRVPGHETAFAMTVHKSQGSEFAEVAVVLPDEPSPLLTRELLYTAVSRARNSLLLFGAPEVLRQAVAQRVVRSSGLRQRLAAAE